MSSTNKKRRLEDPMKDAPAAKKQKLNENDTKLDGMAFKKSLCDILNSAEFVCHTETMYSWKVVDLEESKILKSIKQALNISINKIVNNGIDDDISNNILSFIYVSDRILCCIEDQSELMEEEVDTKYHNIDRIYHAIINGGLDSNVKYTNNYNELAFEYNKYLNPKDMIQDLYLGGFGDEDETENSKKREVLSSKIDEFKDLINKYKNEGILRKYSPYSIKVPDPDTAEIDELIEETEEDNLNDEDILYGYKENHGDESWNDGESLSCLFHYVVFQFNNHNKRIAMRANVVWN